MKLVVRVIEAKNLVGLDSNGLSELYVQLKLGRQKYRTKVIKNLTPIWDEQFYFSVDDLKEKLVISLKDVKDEEKFIHNHLVARLKLPVSSVFEEENKSLGDVWYSLKSKKKKFKNKEGGEIHLSIFISQNHVSNHASNHASTESNASSDQISHSRKLSDAVTCSPSHSKTLSDAVTGTPSHSKTLSDAVTGTPSHSRKLSDAVTYTPSHSRKLSDAVTYSPSQSSNGRSNSSSPVREEIIPSKDEKSSQKTFASRLAQIFNKISDGPSVSSNISMDYDSSETDKVEAGEIKTEDQTSDGTFEEIVRKMQSADQESEIPSNLPGGVLIDQLYVIATEDLNVLLFSPNSSFPKSISEVQGTTDVQMGPWKLESENKVLKRSLTYIKAATKLMKAIKGYEEQTYLKADGKNFAVLASVSTPDVMYGSTFKAEVLYVITPGPELSSEEQCSRLVISWRMNFLQSTMMKGVIENGARQGMKESFDQYAILLSQTVKPVDSKDLGSTKEQALAALKAEPLSEWKFAMHYFANFTFISTFLMGLYVLIHIWLATPTTIQGLESYGLDLPDSISEFAVCAILTLQGQRMWALILRFMRARSRKGSDHGIKARGDGWLLTVAIIEGSNLPAIDSTRLCNPYIVFTCNGKTRGSSIKFRTSDPLWNEIFEFDAMDEPPSVLELEVNDFDGPFDEPQSLGHAEINFLKTNISDLADLWVSLEGKLALACHTKVHLRIFLDNTRGGNVVRHYLSKMEKEVGKKINLRSPQTNSAFQKLFGLPPEEFLINDFTCHLKRKMPLQGRLFVSARIMGFHANLFGHKTRFFLLWEDIEDIQVIPPTFSSMGSPIIVVTLRPGRGVDAKHGAKTQDDQGRLKFHFQSFVSFNVANRTIMALWKARSLSIEQKVQLVEDDPENESVNSEESVTLIGSEDVSMSEVHSCSVQVPVSFFMELFSGGELDCRIMEKSGCANYSSTPWVSENNNVYERAVYYKFEKRISRYKVEVTSTQQKSLLDGNGCLLEEVMNFHGVPLGDYFNLHLRYQINEIVQKTKGCKVQVLFGIEWLKNTKHQKRITKNLLKNLQERLRLTISLVEKEFLERIGNRANILTTSSLS